MDSGDVQTRTIHTSENYLFRLKQLLRAAGYDAALLKKYDPHTENEETRRAKKEYLEKALGELADFIAKSDKFYPEDIASEFIEWHARLRGPLQDGRRAQAEHAIAEIIRAGFFNDDGVESYASPCTPMVLGLAEVAVQAQAGRADTRFVLGSADICNLTGLNNTYKDREKTKQFLAHMVHMPREATEKWAKAHGYRVETMIVRAGGDEFKYIQRFRTLNRSPIEESDFKKDMQELQQLLTEENKKFAKTHGVDSIKHHKSKPEAPRAPGVMNTLAIRPLDAHHPNIQHTMVELGADIAAIRGAMEIPPYVPGKQPKRDMVELPTTKPAEHHPIIRADIYHDTALEPTADESLERLCLRLALEKAGFNELAKLQDLFVYKPAKRWSELNAEHPEFRKLDEDTQKLITRITEAEHMRGVIDPVSRCYSLAFYKDCEDLALHQGRARGIIVHLKNLSGMNSLGDAFGDAVLREVGSIIDKAYDAAMIVGDPTQKPIVVRRAGAGGEFTVFLDNAGTEAMNQAFSQKITEGIKALNATDIAEFAAEHNIQDAITKNGYTTIGSISYPGKDAFGVNRGLFLDFIGEEYENDPTTNRWTNRVRKRETDPRRASPQSL